MISLVTYLKRFYIVIAFALLFYMLARMSVMVVDLPSNDFSSTIAKIWFMSETGLGETPYWYSGYYPFLQYPFLSSAIGAFLYLISGNLGLALYLLILLTLISCFFGFLFLKKIRGWSMENTLIIFLAFFVNPVSAELFFKVGRTTELFGWIFLIISMAFIYNYKEKNLDAKFLLIIIPLTLTILGHPSAFILLTFPLLGLLISKLRVFSELLTVTLAGVASLALSSWWWARSIIAALNGHYVTIVMAGILGQYNLIRVYSIFFPIVALVYIALNKNTRYMALPLTLVSIIYLTGIVEFIPIYNQAVASTYALIIIFMILVDLNQKELDKIYVLLALIAFSLSLLIIYDFKTISEDSDCMDSYELLGQYTSQDFIAIFDATDFEPGYGYLRCRSALYSYSPIFYNHTTPYGFFVQAENSYLNTTRQNLDSRNCEIVNSSINSLRVNLIVSNKCDFLSSCGLKKDKQRGQICTFLIDG